MEVNNLKFDFAFTDEFGQTINYKRELTDANLMDGILPLMVEQFKCFLLAQGFLPKQVDNIYYDDKD